PGSNWFTGGAPGVDVPADGPPARVGPPVPPPEQHMTRQAVSVGVVGAGPAGLAAASRLAAAGVTVNVYDAQPEPGGRMRTAELNGVRLDPAVQLLGSYYTETWRLAEWAGAASLRVRAPGRDALWRGGQAHPVSYGSVLSMAASKALSTGLKV